MKLWFEARLFVIAVVVIERYTFDLDVVVVVVVDVETCLFVVAVVVVERYIFDRKQSSSVCASLYCSRLPILPEVILLIHLYQLGCIISIVKFATAKRINKTQPSDVHFRRQDLRRKKQFFFHLLGNPTLRNVYSNCQTWLKFSNTYKCNFPILFLILCVITFPAAFKLIAIISNSNI